MSILLLFFHKKWATNYAAFFSIHLCWAQAELEADSCIPESFRAHLSSLEHITVYALSQFCAENIVFARTPHFAICS